MVCYHKFFTFCKYHKFNDSCIDISIDGGKCVVNLTHYRSFLLLYQYKYCIYAKFLPDVVSVDGDDDSEWLHRGQLTQNNEKTGTSYLQCDIITCILNDIVILNDAGNANIHLY
jgi:hypothetical protein